MAGSKEDAGTVSAFFQDMRQRGLGDPLLAVSDGAPGLIQAIENGDTAHPIGALGPHRHQICASTCPISHMSGYSGIDCYAPDMQHGSEDAADASKTVRVLTSRLASEY